MDRKPTSFLVITLLAIILGVASWIRLYRSAHYFPFQRDQSDDLTAIQAIRDSLVSGNFGALPLAGQIGTYQWPLLSPKDANPVYHGVLYYYLLLPAAVIAQFDPYGVVVFFIGIGILTVYLLYVAGVLLSGSFRVGIIAAFFGAVSYWLSAYSRWIWTPSMMPVFAVLALIAFLHVIKGDRSWWYVLAPALSAASQIHDSGFALWFIYGILFLVWRPAFPKGWLRKLLTILLFFVPLAPTAIYEVENGFRLVRALGIVAIGSVTDLSSTGSSIATFVGDALGLSQQPWYFAFIHSQGPVSAVGWLIVLGVVLWGIGIWTYVRRNKIAGQGKLISLVWLWWLACIPMPLIVKYIYGVPNANARVYNMLFAYPMFYVSLAALMDLLWQKKNIIVRAVCICFIVWVAAVNFQEIHGLLWRYSGNTWAYGDLKSTALTIQRITRGLRYNLTVYGVLDGSYPTSPLFQIVYLLNNSHAGLPETFNGVPVWSYSNVPIPLSARPAGMNIFVIERSLLSTQMLPEGVELVGETNGYQIYKIGNSNI